MFSWITGPRITNVVQDLQADPALDTTFIEPPETPAPVFVARAFKHAIFGTPAPEEAKERPSQRRRFSTSTDRKTLELASDGKKADFLAEIENAPLSSPTKPNGILRTPGTAAKGRKNVAFPAHVLDNEGKKVTVAGRSGLPNDYPGKFPSPWTPATQLLRDNEEKTEKNESGGSEIDTKEKTTKEKDSKEKQQKPRSRLTAALYDAKKPSPDKAKEKPKEQAKEKPKAKDDNDLTLQMMQPRSDSGKFWKEQYMTYAEQTEIEIKKIVEKQKSLKNYAKKKDGEAMELATRLFEERRRHNTREKTLEDQTKEYQERLRQAMSENLRASMEIAALKSRIATLEAGASTPENFNKPAFQIHEDSHKESPKDGTQKGSAQVSSYPAPGKDESVRRVQPEVRKIEERVRTEPAKKSERASIDQSRKVERPSIDQSRRTERSREPGGKKAGNMHGERAQNPAEPAAVIFGKPVPTKQDAPTGKENSPPKLRHLRRNTVSSDSPPKDASTHTDLVSGVYNLSKGSVQHMSDATNSRESAPLSTKSPLSIRPTNLSKENIPPPPKIQFSPLNQHPPSPDPWMPSDFIDSPLPQMDRLALPIGSGAPSQPARRATTTMHNREPKERKPQNQDREKQKRQPNEEIEKDEENEQERMQREANGRKVAQAMKDEIIPVDRKAAAMERLERRRWQNKYSPDY